MAAEFCFVGGFAIGRADEGGFKREREREGGEKEAAILMK